MRNGFLIMIGGALLLAGSAEASVGWAQNFNVGAVNRVEWLGGIGSAGALNRATFNQNQDFSSLQANISAFQKQASKIFQNATASGMVGPSTSVQNAAIKGEQNLNISDGKLPSAGARQSLEGAFTNQVIKPEGAGDVSGVQRYVGSQEQGISTPYGSGTQSQNVEVVQRGHITTGLNTDPTVTSTINLQLSQSQMINGM